MNKIIITSIILIIGFPIQGFSQAIKIPVIPYNKRSSSLKSKIHNKCKSVVNYSKCVKRYSRVY